jgi:hypothetical protein
MEAPIPQPRLDDDEDVHWALSTAVALWGRSEHTEALKWLRRAAEQASDVNADKRALELFKAAAEVANMVGKGGSMAPPPPPPAQQTPTPAPAEAAPQAATGPRPPPVPPPRHRAAPPPVPPAGPPSVRPPSMPAPPPAAPIAAAIPAASRPPAVPGPQTSPQAAPGRSVPPPVQKPQSPAPAPSRPSMPSIPQIAAPTRPVAISAAKPMAQAVAPKRKRSFSGEARPVEKARGSEAARAHPSHKRRRTHTGDELHLPATPAEPENIWDDLDEDTRVISARERPRDEIDQALARLRAAPAPPAPASPQATPGSRDDAASSTTHPGAADWRPNDTVSPIQAAERAPVAAPESPRKLDTLPSLRVAVLATGIAGEVRLISLDATEVPPPGAALAVLVPLSAADGDAISRLFRAID